MIRARQVVCLSIALLILRVNVFAAPYVEECSGIAAQDHRSVLNLEPVAGGIGRTLKLDVVPDDTAFAVASPYNTGSMVLHASGVQRVRVGFYSAFGIYAVYSSAGDTYCRSGAYVTGQTKRMTIDPAKNILCVQDDDKSYYLYLDSHSYEYSFVPVEQYTADPEKLIPFGANISVSHNNISYVPLQASLVNYRYGAELSTQRETNAYCELEAAIPEGYRYIKIELNQPGFYVSNRGTGALGAVNAQFKTYLSRVTLDGDAVALHSLQETSSKPSSSAPPATSSGIEEQGKSAGEKVRRRTEDTAASAADGTYYRVDDVDGIGRQIAHTAPPSEPQADVSDEVLAAEIQGQESGQATAQEKAYDEKDAIITNNGQSVQYTGQSIKEIICLIVGAVGVSAATYTAITLSRSGGKKERPPQETEDTSQ